MAGKITYSEPLDYFPKELRDKFTKRKTTTPKKTTTAKKTTTKKKSK